MVSVKVRVTSVAVGEPTWTLFGKREPKPRTIGICSVTVISTSPALVGVPVIASAEL